MERDLTWQVGQKLAAGFSGTEIPSKLEALVAQAKVGNIILFEENIRDYEYACVVELALEALTYDDIVLINAPFTREIRDMQYIAALKEKLAAKNATLVVIWVETEPEIVHQRMIARNSDRDTWKLAHWDEYLAGCNFAIPDNLDDPSVKDDLLIFRNNDEEEFEQSMRSCLKILEETMDEDFGV